MPGSLEFMLVFFAIVTVVLLVLVIYGNALDSREDEEIFVNREEEKMMAGDQPALVARMDRLGRIIKVLAVLSVLSLLASAGIWIYTGLYK